MCPAHTAAPAFGRFRGAPAEDGAVQVQTAAPAGANVPAGVTTGLMSQPEPLGGNLLVFFRPSQSSRMSACGTPLQNPTCTPPRVRTEQRPSRARSRRCTTTTAAAQMSASPSRCPTRRGQGRPCRLQVPRPLHSWPPATALPQCACLKNVMRGLSMALSRSVAIPE